MAKNHYALHMHLSKKKQKTFIDKIVLVAAFVSPLTGIPQILLVFQNKAEGVSLSAWIGFAFFSVLFFTYGIIHKVKPMIITNALWFIVDSLVVIGILMQRT